jgi:putative spermidine/putrescine transport system permease protein
MNSASGHSQGASVSSDLVTLPPATRRRALVVGLLLAPGLLTLLFLLLLPLVNVVLESFRQYVPGKIGGLIDAPYTLNNYTALLHPVYLEYLTTTIWSASLATLGGLVMGYPVAYVIARTNSHAIRISFIALLVGLLFLSALIRVYSLELSFGSVGLGPPLAVLMGVSPNSRAYAEFLVVIGLVHHSIPLAALLITATIQNINPRLVEAAQALGAPLWRGHLSITLPLSMPGILSAFLICYTTNLSAFVVPMILGKGKISFLSNLVYDRYAELANFPSGSAIALQLLAVAVVVTYGIGWLLRRQFGEGIY